MKPSDPPARPALDRPALLAALHARSARAPDAGGRNVPLCEAVDRHLPGGGLARAAMHEVLAADPEAAAGFCALALARAGGSVLWIGEDDHPPGLSRFGLSPADLVLVRVSGPEDALWAMEEALRRPGIAGALLALPPPGPDAVLRLQQAAEAGGALGLLLRPEDETGAESAGAASTLWRIGTLGGSAGFGDPRWRLDLLRCRAGRPGRWEVVWRAAAESLEIDAEEGFGQAPPAQRPRRRVR